MFKRFLSLVLALMLVTSGAFAARKNEVMQKRVFLQDGSSHIVNTVIRNGISLMEVRSFAEVMNFELYFEKDGAKKVVRLVDYPVGLSLYVDSTKARQYDGMTNHDLKANYATTVIDGRTYVPARFLVESLGYNISLEDKGYYIGRPQAIAQNVDPQLNITPEINYEAYKYIVTEKLVPVSVSYHGNIKEVGTIGVETYAGFSYFIDAMQFGDLIGFNFLYNDGEVALKRLDEYVIFNVGGTMLKSSKNGVIGDYGVVAVEHDGRYYIKYGHAIKQLGLIEDFSDPKTLKISR